MSGITTLRTSKDVLITERRRSVLRDRVMKNPKPVTILLVEDDQGHAVLVEKNLRRSNILNDLILASTGQQALNYLFGEGDYAQQGQPNSPTLILLDLNLPVLDGYQVLERLKSDPRTRRIPVIILTSTDDPREVARCYELGCNIYVAKPIAYEQFTEAIHKLGLFLSIVTVPLEN